MKTRPGAAVLDAMTQRRRLPPRVVAGFHQPCAFSSPAGYDDAAPMLTNWTLRQHPGLHSGGPFANPRGLARV